MKKLKINEIAIDQGTQTRVTLNEETIADYAAAMTEGAKFPAIVVFASGTDYLLADGFHRFMAAQRCGWREIDADIRKGSRLDAIKYSLGANNSHGLRRTNADKRRCVEIALREFGKISDRAIAQICGVSNDFVGGVRKVQVSSDDTSNSKTPAKANISEPPPFRTGRDGKEYPVRDPGPPPYAPRASEGRPPDPTVKDPRGKTIPKKLLALWSRAQEIQDMCTALSRIRTAVEEGAEKKDPLYAELNPSQVKAALDTAYTAIKATMPYCLCPSCQGEGCRACSHRGLIGRFRFDTVIPKELKK